MIKNLSKEKILNTTICTIFFVCIIFAFLYFGNYCFLKFEDILQPFMLPHNLLEIYTGSDHGCFFSTILYQLLVAVIPKAFNIHPNDFRFIYVFQGFIYWLIPLLLTRFVVLFTNKKYFLFFYIISNMLFFTVFLNWDCLLVEYGFIYSRFIRYVFTMTFLVLFWSLFSDFYIFNKYKNFQLYLSAFCMGISVEPFNVTTLFALIIITIFSLFNNKVFKSISWSIYLKVISFFLLGLGLFYANPNFWNIAKERGIQNQVQILNTLAQDFSSFNSEYLNLVLKSNWHYILAILLLVVVMFKIHLKNKEIRNTKVITTAAGLFVGILAFNYLLILSGRTYYDGINFWIYSRDIKLETSFVFIMIIIFLASYIIGKLKTKDSLNFAVILILFSICNYCCFCNLNFGNIIYSKKQEYMLRQLMYKSEKMYRFYSLRHYKTAYLPLSALKDENLYFTFDLNADKTLESAMKNAKFPSGYYSHIYSVPSSEEIKIKLVDDEEAYESFNKNGGTFTPEELKELSFTKLLNSDFVLNGNKIKG